MRIIGGEKKGYKIHAPRNIPTRPTTDRSKEGMFNILANWYDFDNCDVLDLYAGTGNITYEFASRGAQRIVSVDRFPTCADFIQSECDKLGFDQVHVVQADVIDILKGIQEDFDIIFSDAPFATNDYEEVHSIIFERNLLRRHGTFVMEHHSANNFDHLPHFIRRQAYGQNILSIYAFEE